MYVGFTLSLLAHLTLLGWALINFQATPPLKVGERQAVEVALITPDDLVRLTKGDRTSKNLKTRQSKQLEKAPVKKTAKKAVIKTTPPPAASEPPAPETPDKPDDISKKLSSLAEPPTPAGPTPAELAAKKAAAEKFIADKLAEEAALQKAAEEKKKKAEADKKRKAEAEKKRKAAEAKRRKAEARKKKRAAAKRARARTRKLAEKRRRERQAKKFDPGKLSALLNKIPDSKAPAAGSRDPNNDRQLPKGPQAGARDGNDTRLTASQQSFMRSRIQNGLRPCWILPGGGGGTSAIPVVTLRWNLRRDGSLDGNPQVVNGRSGATFAAAAAAAQRAVIQCQPIRLPPELYANWKTIEWEFDPREMQ